MNFKLGYERLVAHFDHHPLDLPPPSVIFFWDGILSTYGDNVFGGFDSGQCIYFASFHLAYLTIDIAVSAHLFRSLDFADNQVQNDLVYSDNIVANLASYQYTAGYFFKGTDAATNTLILNLNVARCIIAPGNHLKK